MSELDDIECGQKQPKIQPNEVHKLARYLTMVDEITWLALGLAQLNEIIAELEKPS